jgi:hypothetical protein
VETDVNRIDETRACERDASALREALNASGLPAAAAASELRLDEAELQAYLSGRCKVPRAVLLAMRWIAEHGEESSERRSALVDDGAA